MKKIVLACLSMVILFSSCSKTKQKMVVSKYSNDTLYTYNVPGGQNVTSFDVPFEKTISPSVNVIMKKALVDKMTAKKWIQERKSENMSVVSKPKKHIPIILILCLMIVLLFYMMGRSAPSFNG